MDLPAILMLLHAIACNRLVAGYDDDGVLAKPKPHTTLHFLTHVISVISLAYTSARLGIVENLHRVVDGERTGSALLIASVVFSFLALVSSIRWRAHLTKKVSMWNVDSNLTLHPGVLQPGVLQPACPHRLTDTTLRTGGSRQNTMG